MWTRSNILLTAALALLGSSTVWAGSYTIQPTRIELSPRRPSISVQITNVAEEATTIQAHLVAWTANGAEELQINSDALILNPPIFTLAPHKTQFMRIGLRKQQFSAAEVTYRLILEELPPPPNPEFSGVRTLLRLSVPIFIAPPGLQPQTTWTALRHEGKITLRAVNLGKAHVQVRNISLRSAEGAEATHNQSFSTYLLPTGWKEWTFEEGQLSRAEQLIIDAQTDGKSIREKIQIQSR
jgi:fimbrial chaperone protein